MAERLGDWYNPEDLREYEDPRPDWLKGRSGMLSDRDILRCLEEGIIQIFPLPEDLEECLGPTKLDFHLGNTFTIFKRGEVAEMELEGELPPEVQEYKVIPDGRSYLLHPGETILATTREHLVLPNFIAARVEGKSGLARRGLGIQLAALIDPGWKRQPVLELHNSGLVALRLKPPQRIGAFSFELLISPALFPYGSKPEHRYAEQEVAKP